MGLSRQSRKKTSSSIEGQEVEFEQGQGRDGRPQAVKVRPASPK